MIKRYTRPAMGMLWEDLKKFQLWLDVELAWLKARTHFGELTSEAYEAIKTNAKVNMERLERYEDEKQHDLIAFVCDIMDSLEEAGVGQYKGEFHKELTSYDIEDPAFILRLRKAVAIVLDGLKQLKLSLWKKALEHKWTIMLAETHGQDAEPTTLGALLVVFVEAIDRSIERLNQLLKTELKYGKISGAVGVYGSIKPEFEAKALGYLGLWPAAAETQILQRDRIAAVANTLQVVAGSMEQIARVFWEMMRSRNNEIQEPKKKTQRGSSAMPWKRNPIITERIMGMARVVRGYALSANECIATPGHRAIEQSCVERIVIPDAFILVDYMCSILTKVVDGLVVFTDNMRHNLEVESRGVWTGQFVRNALIDAGIEYNVAYEYVKDLSFYALDNKVHILGLYKERSLSDSDTRTAFDVLGEDKLKLFFDPMTHIENGVEHIFKVQEEKWKIA